MHAAPAGPAGRGTPDPFAFPSETHARFALLIASVLAAALIVYQALLNSVPAFWAQKQGIEQHCEQLAAQHYPDPRTIAERTDRRRAVAECWLPHDRTEAVWLIGTVAGMFGLALGLYAIWPAWRIRRRRLVVFGRDDDAALADHLAALGRAIGLTRLPVILLDPRDPTAGGLAFGSMGRYYVVLAAGLVLKYHGDRDAFDAIVRHELAHLRNADVDRTYLTMSVWYAFVIAALAPLAVAFADNRPAEIAAMAWRMLALTALVYLMRNAVLRAREVHADLRAAPGAQAALARVLGRMPLPRRRWLALASTHPDPLTRQRLLDSPEPVFRIGFWEMAGIGAAAALAQHNVEYLLSLLLPFDAAVYTALGAALVLGALIVRAAVAGIWRSAMVEAGGGPAVAVLAPGLGLAAGVLFGRHVSLVSYALGRAEQSLSGYPGWLFEGVWSLLLVVGALGFVAWLRTVARAWLHAGVTRPRFYLSYRLALIAAAVVLAVMLGLLFFVVALKGTGGTGELEQGVQELAARAGATGPGLWLVLGGVLLFGMLAQPGALIVLTALWLLPLLARWLPDRGGTAEPWAWRTPPTGSNPAGPAGRSSWGGRLSLAVATIVAAGVSAWVAPAHPVPAALLTLVVAIAIAVVATVRASGPRWAVGAGAAVAAGSAMAAAGVAAAGTHGLDMTTAREWLVLLVNGVSLAALVVAVPVSTWCRRGRPA